MFGQGATTEKVNKLTDKQKLKLAKEYIAVLEASSNELMKINRNLFEALYKQVIYIDPKEISVEKAHNDN